MFEVPSAKRVKRSQLFDDSGEEENDVKVKIRAEEGHSHTETPDALPDYGFEYEFISETAKSKPVAVDVDSGEAVHEAEAYQFNLFAPARPTPSKEMNKLSTTPSDTFETGTQPLLISIRSPSPNPDTTETQLFINERPDTYYFTSALPPQTLQKLRDSYRESAISSSVSGKLSTSSWPGTHLPWRIINLPSHTKQVVIHKVPSTTPTQTQSTSVRLHAETDPSRSRRRPRPSKKRRDLTRQKVKRRQVIIDETKTKEEHEREKKNKKNRERKLKRRAKERREKEATKGTDGGIDEASVDVGGSDAISSVAGED